jgi:hypothetical protein
MRLFEIASIVEPEAVLDTVRYLEVSCFVGLPGPQYTYFPFQAARMDNSENTIDPSKLSLKERIKFFASKGKQGGAPTGAPVVEKALSPTRAALSASTSTRTRSLATSLVSGLGESRASGAASRVFPGSTTNLAPPPPGVGGVVVAPTAVASAAVSEGAPVVDKELSDALSAPTVVAAALATTALVEEEIAAPKAPITVALPGGSVEGLGLRVEKCEGRPYLLVLSVDPEGFAGKAGVVVGCAMSGIDGVGLEEGLTEEGVMERMSACLREVAGGRSATFTFQHPTLQ